MHALGPTPRLKGTLPWLPGCLPGCLSHQVLRLGRGDHHGVLHVRGPEHLGLAPRRHARGRVDPVRKLRARVDELGDPRSGEADRAASGAVPPSERLDG